MSTTKPLPPGSTGWPLVGETLAFLGDPFGFTTERVRRHGSVFRTRLLGRDTVYLVGPGVTASFIDAEQVRRDGAMPKHIEQIFGGRSLPMLDGDTHRARKECVLAAFTPEALAGYLPAIRDRVERTLDDAAGRREVACIDVLPGLALEIICENIVGLGPGEDFDALLRDYPTAIAGLGALPVPIPGTKFAAALKARDRILPRLAAQVADHRESPRDDGLGRILAAEASDGTKLTDEQALLELHHIFLAGYIVFAQMMAAVAELSRRSAVRNRLIAEIDEHAPEGHVTHQQLAKMPYLGAVAKEIKRWTPVVPTQFGIAKKTLEIGGFSIPEGWMLVWAPWSTCTSDEVFSNPVDFDPERFLPERAEDAKHEHAYVPQGAGPMSGHKCAGFDHSTVILEVFLVVLLRAYDWTLSEQRLEYDYSKIPPEHAEGLRVSFSKRAGRKG